MIATIDAEGRIALAQGVQNQLGLRPGDEVIIEPRGHELVIKGVYADAGLRGEGTAPLHASKIFPNAPDEAEFLDDLGPIRLPPRPSRTVAAKIQSVPRRPLSATKED